MTETVLREATVKDTDDARLIRKLVEDGELRRASPKAESARLIEDFRLDEGEAETIALAKEKGATCGTDDGAAIRCVKVLGLPFTSAIALLAAMAEGGIIQGELAMELLGKLEHFGRYEPRILEEAARRVRASGRQDRGGRR